jgi:purine-nucleoside phosphorylase
MAEDREAPLLQACELLYHAWGDIRPHTCLICGSGWGEIVEGLSPVSSIPYEQIMGMGRTTVEGHKGNLWLAKPEGKEVLIFQGRRHFYEAAGWGPVIFPVLLTHELGIRSVVLTNAAGGIREDLQPGDLMVLSDHLNFMGNNPLIGEILHSKIPRFPDQSEVYDRALCEKIHQSSMAIGQKLHEGTYLALSGPAFETPAEIRAFAKLGADAVGMSTAPEAMVANSLGMKVAAISCISNLAAGRSTDALSHEDVQKTSEKALPKMTSLLAHFLPSLAEG